jgi:hypothetical protein
LLALTFGTHGIGLSLGGQCESRTPFVMVC